MLGDTPHRLGTPQTPGRCAPWTLAFSPFPRREGGRGVRSVRALCLLFALVLAIALPSSAQAATRPHYDLQVSLNFRAATLDVVQKTTLRNDTGVQLPDLVFHAVPAFFNSFTLQSAQVDGREVEASRKGTVLDLKLNAPLDAGATATVELRYQVKVPAIGGRFGRGEGILALGNWFPVLAVYQQGWDRHQYVDVGDAFYTEVADFDVAVTSDVPVKIATSGQLAGQEGNTQIFRAENVRDFAMAISDRYQVRTRDVDGVQVAVYGPSPAHLDVYLAEAEKTLRWFSANLGPYPYPSLSVAEIHAADYVPTAQEYPALIFVYSALGADGGGPGSYSEYTVGHEMAHQWFYSLVGNDQVHDPWLDEALATYADMLFYRDLHPRSFDYYWGRIVAGYRARAAAGGDRPVNSSIYDFPNDLPYFDIVYRKGAIFLDELRQLMGDERFLGLLRDYVRAYSGKVATPRDFLGMAYDRVGPALPPLVARYFTYDYFADGAGRPPEAEQPTPSPTVTVAPTPLPTAVPLPTPSPTAVPLPTAPPTAPTAPTTPSPTAMPLATPSPTSLPTPLPAPVVDRQGERLGGSPTQSAMVPQPWVRLGHPFNLGAELSLYLLHRFAG